MKFIRKVERVEAWPARDIIQAAKHDILALPMLFRRMFDRGDMVISSTWDTVAWRVPSGMKFARDDDYVAVDAIGRVHRFSRDEFEAFYAPSASEVANG